MQLIYSISCRFAFDIKSQKNKFSFLGSQNNGILPSLSSLAICMKAMLKTFETASFHSLSIHKYQILARIKLIYEKCVVSLF